MVFFVLTLPILKCMVSTPHTKVCQKIVYVSTVLSKYFPNQDRYSRNQDIVRKLVQRQIFLKFKVLVMQTGAIDDQSFEFLLNNFARLTNIISEECTTFALFKSVLFRLQLLFIVFKL